jgi:uncharacterized membrane-anchored protein YhcB (DUF1043 family)
MKNRTLLHEILISIVSGVIVGTIVGRILRRQQIATAQAAGAITSTVRG